MNATPRAIVTQIQQTDWHAYTHAYGDATDIPAYLMALFNRDPKVVMAAIGDLDIRLCHQHSSIEPALEPALPILLAALAHLEDDALASLLELFWGIADVAYPRDPLRSIRQLDLTRTTVPPPPPLDPGPRFQQVRRMLAASQSTFEGLLRHPHNDVFEWVVLQLREELDKKFSVKDILLDV